eukprot:2020960-Rhodomonas_salina.1
MEGRIDPVLTINALLELARLVRVYGTSSTRSCTGSLVNKNIQGPRSTKLYPVLTPGTRGTRVGTRVPRVVSSQGGCWPVIPHYE